jgi:hypothetical protein
VGKSPSFKGGSSLSRAGGFLNQVFARGCQGEVAVLDALGGYELLPEVLDNLGVTLEDDDFKAVVMIEMHMQR